MTQEEKADRLLFLGVLAQTCIDSLEDEIGLFRFKHKQIAKAFLDEWENLLTKYNL